MKPKHTLIHVSDMHIGKGPMHDGVVEKLLLHIGKTYPKDTLLFVTGDITSDSDEEQYQRAAEMLEPFRERILIAPGNHDYAVDKRSVLFSERAMERFETHMTRRFGMLGSYLGRNAPIMEDFHEQKILALGVDSNRETKSPLDFNRGCVGEPQISLLREQLKNPYYDENGYLKVVYLHHRPIDFAGPVETIMGLDDKEEFLDDARGADLVLFGHRHQKEIIRNRHGIGVLVGAPPAFEGEYVEIGVFDDNHIDATPRVLVTKEPNQ
uniref:3',5'-cyclic AMP phosphodiesterase CpdA n=1 Tax=Candidatus Kentrum sp. TC TaxID=2126339 RepID=A0A450ZG94_9GAMM|nr:MAG: 3',5'-cyclic AMP phosphodiesterase CpdA [Candidatus Kentron sp. TC]